MIKTITTLSLCAAAVLANAGLSHAQSAMSHDTMSAASPAPKMRCAAGDVPVMVDMTTMTYVTFDPSHDAPVRTTTAAAHHGDRMETMCKSKAASMGARPTSSSIMKGH